jgi:hypothetical protein
MEGLKHSTFEDAKNQVLSKIQDLEHDISMFGDTRDLTSVHRLAAIIRESSDPGQAKEAIDRINELVRRFESFSNDGDYPVGHDPLDLGLTQEQEMERSDKNYRIEHFPPPPEKSQLDIIINLDYGNNEDIDFILNAIKNNSSSKSFGLNGFLTDVELLGIKNPKYVRFFIKRKIHHKQYVDFLVGRRRSDPVREQFRDDFDKKSRYAMAGVLNEIVLSKKIKEIVKSSKVQKLAKDFGFSEMIFSEPIMALIPKESDYKFLIYKNIPKYQGGVFTLIPLTKNLNDLTMQLRDIFFKNGIHPHDLRTTQFMMTGEGDKKVLVLSDTEAYTEIPKPKEEK